ncbi:unnamed protein product [Nippostrongylus brasiliensis]|uniref:Uncharacterized protein n=1 Tax=Nippostrongylus brasiliensis TaxID=27835 RepID=A0A0N4XC71_NIPBR|nr:unnamed protein product [Nippostrongylus brasiliensis]
MAAGRGGVGGDKWASLAHLRDPVVFRTPFFYFWTFLTSAAHPQPGKRNAEEPEISASAFWATYLLSGRLPMIGYKY